MKAYKEIKTSIFGFELIVFVNGKNEFMGCMTEEGGTYPLLENERIHLNAYLAFENLK